jgi:hypothetical protein
MPRYVRMGGVYTEFMWPANKSIAEWVNAALLYSGVRKVDLGAATKRSQERVKGIEPSPKAWEAFVLPLNYTRERLLPSSATSIP